MSKIDLAIKFGSNEIIIYRKGFGIIAKVPAYLAITREEKKVKVKAYGKQAEKLLHINSQDYEVLNPIHNSTIVDEKMAITLLSKVMEEIIEDKFFLSKIEALVAVPSTLKEEDLIKIKRVLQASGISKVSFVFNSVCARELVELDPHSHIMVVDIGKFLTDISVLNEFNFNFGRTYFIGGADMDKSITTFVADNHGLTITERTSEFVKNELASLYERDLNSTDYSGFDDNQKLVKHQITANEIRVAIQSVYDKIFEFIEEIVKTLPKEISQDIYNCGVMFVGGASTISGLYEYAKKRLDLPVIMPDNPVDAVILGAGKLLSTDKEFLKLEI